MSAITRERWRTAGVVVLTAATMALLTPLILLSITAIETLCRGAGTLGRGDLAILIAWNSNYSPGAALLGGALCAYLRWRRLTWRQRLWRGALLGIVAGWLDVPLTRDVFKHQLYSWSGPAPLHERLITALKTTIDLQAMGEFAHFFVPCGALLGFWVGALAQLGLPRDREERDPA